MYSDLFFLLLVFLLPNLVTNPESYLVKSPAQALLIGAIGSFFALILVGGLGLAARYANQSTKNILLLVTNNLLIFSLVCFFLLLGAERSLLAAVPSQTFSALLAIGFYLGGLWLFHLTATPLKAFLSGRQAIKKIRFLIPFIMPFLFFSACLDLALTFPTHFISTTIETHIPFFTAATAIGFTACFLFALLFFFPYLVQKIWQCKPLSETHHSLAVRLNALCQKAKFQQSGIKTWTVMNDSLTAAIIGILPSCRYVVFSKKLLHALSPEAIEAVLAHEIGHNHRKHLLLYPFIIIGMVLILSSLKLEEKAVSPLFTFAIYSIVIVSYLRIILGFFSRIFERQADLHVYELSIAPEAMIEALEDVSVASGNIHKLPNWHHYSIQERIDFLQETILHPELIQKHHHYVKKCFAIYLIFLALLSIIVFYI